MFSLTLGILTTVLAGPATIQQDQKIQSVLIVSTKRKSDNVHEFHEAKTKSELDTLAKGKYVFYPSPVTAIVEDDDPLGIDLVKESIEVIRELQSSGVKPGETRTIGSYSPRIKKFLTNAITNPAYGQGKFSDIDKVKSHLLPTTIFYLESKGHRVGAVYQVKPSGSSLLWDDDSLPTMEKFVSSPDNPSRPTTVLSGDLHFSAGFASDKTRRELINTYMTTRALERENLLLQLQSLGDTWDPSIKETRELVGKSFNDLPLSVQQQLRSMNLGDFKNAEELDTFLAGAKLVKSFSYVAMQLSYIVEDKRMPSGKRRAGVTFPITP